MAPPPVPALALPFPPAYWPPVPARVTPAVPAGPAAAFTSRRDASGRWHVIAVPAGPAAAFTSRRDASGRWHVIRLYRAFDRGPKRHPARGPKRYRPPAVLDTDFPG